MTESMRREIDFLLHDWLGAETLLEGHAFPDQERVDWDAFMDLSGAISWNEFLPCYKIADRDEPVLRDGRVVVLPDLKRALRTYLDAGVQLATVDPENGGMGFPFVIASAAMAELMAANVSGSGFVMLSVANARVIADVGTPEQVEAFARPQFEGAALGTMCLSEPDVGSSLGDVTTRAEPDGEDHLGSRYRIRGRKMWISAGDQNVTDCIVHLVLGKVLRPDGTTVPGPKGTTLFIVPTYLPAHLGEARNDIAVAGLNHKMGYRGTPNCLLNFGETEGAIGWRLGAEGDGLRIMFQMMNEARTNVGLSGAAMAYRGYQLARTYASERIQGRPADDKQRDKPVPILRHPDVRRMLLVQKTIAEGALALCLKSAMLCDLAETLDDGERRAAVASMLDLLTPVTKSWPSEQGLVALHQAIQVHAGYGYTRDFDVEQLYRDSRLNPIHEGTTGIQAIDLLGRKIIRDGGRSFAAFLEHVRATVDRAAAFPREARQLGELCDLFDTVVTDILAHSTLSDALANATAFLEGFGHMVVAWIWLDVAIAAEKSGNAAIAEEKRWACLFFYAAEVPRIPGMLALTRTAESLTREVPDRVFA